MHVLKESIKNSSFQSKNLISTTRPLEILHMDLFGFSSTLSLGRKVYCFVIVDDYSRFTWVFFLSHKNEAFHIFASYSKRVQIKKATPLPLLEVIEVENSHVSHLNPIVRSMVFCIIFLLQGYLNRMELLREKNRTLQEMERIMLNENGLPKNFW